MSGALLLAAGLAWSAQEAAEQRTMLEPGHIEWIGFGAAGATAAPRRFVVRAAHADGAWCCVLAECASASLQLELSY
jgi:hypothetical protein